MTTGLKGIFLVFLFIAVAACGGASSGSSPVDPSPKPLSSATEQRVMIDSPDGVSIIGTYFGSPKPSSPTLLLLHQWQSDRHSYDEFAKRMQAKGFNVLAIDGRGFGESVKTTEGKAVGPERSDAAVKAMIGDLGAAFDFLTKQKNVDPNRVGIVGASYGSSLALIYAADNPKVKAVALLSPGLNYFGNMPTEPAIAKYGDRPLLLVAAEDDKESADAVRKLEAVGAKPNIEAQIYPQGGHGTGLFGAKVGLEDLLEQFLVRTLWPT